MFNHTFLFSNYLFITVITYANVHLVVNVEVKWRTPPPGQQVKDLVVLNFQPKVTVSFSQLVCQRWYTRKRHLRNQDTNRDAAGFLQPERAARPAGSSKAWQSTGREKRTHTAAPGPLHVHRDHPAASMLASAARSSTTLPLRPGTLKCFSTCLSCRIQTDNWSPAPRNVRGKCVVYLYRK